MYQHLPSPVKFREDINGLRAWAVIAVLLFHFSLIGLPGGFAGVDVFFVISGYLMTAIIVGGYEKGKFSIWKFYMARVRRILPALLAVIAVLLVLGWFWLQTTDYQALGVQSAYSMSFLSNIHYWRSAGYFDSAAEEKWLLHTWSLAVEAQFYLLYPIFIALVWKNWKSLKAITIGVFVLFVASLIFNLIVTGWNSSAAFYLLPTRSWELAAGGLVYLLAKQELVSESLKKNGYWLGWSLVIPSFFFINEHIAWPGYWAIFPVLGTSLIILGQRESCKLTDNAIAQWLGDRSYSLYLWHWPLVVALYFASLQNEWGWVIGAFALSLFFAHLSYKFIETPTRQYLSQANLFKEILLIISVGTVIGLSAISVKFFVFSERTKPSVDIAAREVLNRNSEVIDCTPKMSEMGYVEGCQFGEDKLGALLIGDSHAQAIAGGFIKASKNNSKSIIYRAMPGCSSILNAEKYLKPNEYYRKEACKKFNVDGLNILKELDRSVPLIIVNRFNTAIVGANEKEYSEEAKVFIKKNLKENLTKLISTACLYQKNRQVYLMRSTPEMGVNIPRKLSINKLLGHDIHAVQITLEEYHKRNRLVWEAQDKAVKQCGVKILNPLPYLCDDQYCYGSKNGRPLYYDDDHLSEYGNKFLVPMFEEIFKSNPQN